MKPVLVDAGEVDNNDQEVLSGIDEVDAHLAVMVPAEALGKAEPIGQKADNHHIGVDYWAILHCRLRVLKPSTLNKEAAYVAHIFKRKD